MLLPIAVVEPAFGTLLIAAVGRPMLPAPGFAAARWAAIALSAIATCTDPEHRLASRAAANALPKNHFSMNRHPPAEAGFDKRNDSCDGGVALMVALQHEVAKSIPRRPPAAGFLPPSLPQYKFSLKCLVRMIDG